MPDGTAENRLNVPLFYETLARILSEKYPGIRVTAAVRRRDEPPDGAKPEEERRI